MLERLFLVRHGRYKGGGLTPEGIHDSEVARDELIAKGLGGRALVLSSDLSRAMQSANIIAEGLSARVVPSTRVAVGGNRARAVQSLDWWVQKALEESDTSVDQGQELVVVTHAPLIAVARGLSLDHPDQQVKNGEIFEYAARSWTNPEFQDFYASSAEKEISQQADNSKPRI